MLYLDIRSMLLSGQVPYGTNSSQLCFGMGYSRKKKPTGRVEDILFLKKTLEFFWFFSITLKIPRKTKLQPWKFDKIMYVTCLRNFKAKNPRPLEISHEFFFVSLGNSALFFINLWKFRMLFLEYSWKFYILTLPPVWIFSGIVQSRKSCASSNTALYSRMKITYHQLLVGFFHNLISMQNVGYNMLSLHVDQQLPSL